MGRKVALGGILTAVSLIFLYFAFYLPSMKLTMYFLAGIIPGLILVEMGVKQAWMLYAATSVLSFIILGNAVNTITYIFAFGLYPIIKFYIEKSRRLIIQIILKLVYFNTAIALIYVLWTKLFAFNVAASIPMTWIIIGAQPAFLFYDYIFTKVIFYYCDKIRIKWRKDSI